MTYLLRAFEAAARHLSFKMAAHELHVNAGAVSQQVHRYDTFVRIAEATAELKPDGFTNLLHIGVRGGVEMDDLRMRLAHFRHAQPQVAVRVSQPAGLHELLEGKIDLLIEGSMRRHPGYRCDPIGEGFLIAPLGTADCPEVVFLRSCLLAVRVPSTVPRRTSRSGPPA